PNSWPRAKLQPGLDRPEQPEAHLAVIARERDHEADLPMARGVGIARERAHAIHGTGLVQAAVMAAQQARVRREEREHLGEAARRETVVAADARAFLDMNGFGEALRGEHRVRNLKRLLKTGRRAETVRADLQEDLVGDVVV